MKAVLQRVSKASVTIEGKQVAEIASGLLILLGIVADDQDEDIKWLSNKIVNCRIFPDEQDVMNHSIKQNNGDVIVVSQFTLHANTRKGHRPSYNLAAKPEVAIPLYEAFVKQLELDMGKVIQTGEFGADMKVSLINDGPVTIIIDTKRRD
ncbi:D-aminoacyl-tRNA deacylase [Sediminibacter sp. Hel_I_10]|uniref:D-aminoacyl-tRNA deacylase n=1 Tax=Sediminibacter sp. Hel_I_10 TaxID=1392490 RepID=UPI00047B38F9|nr:D-aminoacyl-tRNA deacylase [Sediminibacter sp. Hel_I_10]